VSACWLENYTVFEIKMEDILIISLQLELNVYIYNSLWTVNINSKNESAFRAVCMFMTATNLGAVAPIFRTCWIIHDRTVYWLAIELLHLRSERDYDTSRSRQRLENYSDGMREPASEFHENMQICPKLIIGTHTGLRPEKANVAAQVCVGSSPLLHIHMQTS
jgi:hypothetical protein